MDRMRVRIENFHGITALAFCTLLAGGCGSGSESPWVELTVLGATDPVEVGTTVDLTAQGRRRNDRTEVLTENVSWSSSADAVATVDPNGRLSALTPGTTTITATFNDVSGTLRVEVVARLESIAIDSPPTAIFEADSEQLAVTGTLSDSTTATLSGGLAWVSSNTDAVSVDATGRITGEGTGTATITVIHSASGLQASAAIDSTALQLVDVALPDTPLSVPLGAQQQLIATGTYNSGAGVPMVNGVSWMAAPPGVVDVSPTGLLTALVEGSTTVTATHDATGLEDTLSILVTSAAIASIALAPDGAGIPVGEIRVMVATAVFTDSSVAVVTDSLEWSTSDDNVATAPSPGRILGVAAGAVTVSAVHPATSVVGTAALDVASGGFVAEGSSATPIDVAGLTPYGGQVDTTRSYYELNGLTPLAAYTVTLIGTTDNVELLLYSDNAFTQQSCAQGSTGGLQVTCAAAANPLGELFIVAEGDSSVAGTAFTLDAQAGGTVNEGSSANPVDITGLTPYAGQVAGPFSYYEVTGLAAGAAYTVTLTDLSDDITLRLTDDSFSITLCIGNQAGLMETCAVAADPSGVVRMRVGATPSPAGGTFTINVAMGGIVNEGTPLTPVDITGLLPYDGAANTESSYIVTGLTADAPYTVTVTNPSVFDRMHAGWSPSTIQCSGLALNSCALAASSTGEVYIRVDTPSGGGTFTVDVTAGGLLSEGSPGSPVALFGQLPYSGVVAPGSPSYYIIDGLSPGAYTVSATGLSANATLELYVDAFSDLNCPSNNSGLQDESCAVSANPSGEIYILMSTSEAGGSTFTLNVASGGLPNEGTFDNPLPLDISALPHAGTTNTSFSYYVIGGLTPGSVYAIFVTGAGVNVSLRVFADTGFGAQLCGDFGTADLGCGASASAAGELALVVGGSQTAAGATFTLDAILGPQGEGSPGSPVDLTGLLLPSYSATAASVSSFYVINGLVAGSPYTVSMTGLTEDGQLNLHPEGSFTDPYCVSNGGFGTPADELCSANANISGQIFVELNSLAALGTPFTLSIASGGLPSEGTAGNPLPIAAGAFPHSGVTNVYASFYTATGLTPNTAYTVTVTGMSDDINLDVYSTDEFDSGSGNFLCQSWFGGLNDETCNVTSTAAGELFIRANGFQTTGGATLTLDVQ